jgi:uncharacterized paraquat-inducible protein A
MSGGELETLQGCAADSRLNSAERRSRCFRCNVARPLHDETRMSLVKTMSLVGAGVLLAFAGSALAALL